MPALTLALELFLALTHLLLLALALALDLVAVAVVGRIPVPPRGWLGLRQPKGPAAVVIVIGDNNNNKKKSGDGQKNDSGDDTGNGNVNSNGGRNSNRNSNVEAMVTAMALGYMLLDDSGIIVTCNRRDSTRDNTPLVLLILPLPAIFAAKNISFPNACPSESRS